MRQRFSHKSPSITLKPRWFKIILRSRRVTDKKPEVIESYISGVTLHETRKQVQDSVGLPWIVSLKEIQYDDIVKELTK